MWHPLVVFIKLVSDSNSQHLTKNLFFCFLIIFGTKLFSSKNFLLMNLSNICWWLKTLETVENSCSIEPTELVQSFSTYTDTGEQVSAWERTHSALRGHRPAIELFFVCVCLKLWFLHLFHALWFFVASFHLPARRVNAGGKYLAMTTSTHPTVNVGLTGA